MEFTWEIIAGIEFLLLVAAAIFFFFWQKASVAKEGEEGLGLLLDFVMGLIKSYLLVLDEEGKIIMCSSSFADKIEGGTKEGLQGVYVQNLKGSYINREIIREIADELRKTGTVNKVYEFLQGNNKSLWIDVKVQPVMQKDKFIGNMVLCSDVSWEMQGKEELLSLVRLRERLLMSISHELKTPLNAIAGSADMLSLSKGLGENERSHVVNIKEAYRTLAHRVDEITEYSNIKNENLIVENREFVLQEIFDVIRNAVYIRTYEKGIGFQISVSPEIPAKLYGDVDKISSVLLHLLLNRAENTEEGYVKLSIQPVHRRGKLFLNYEVSDTGNPIGEEDVKQLFEDDDLEEMNGNAQGRIAIGFTIGREYVKAMGGEIRGESTYDKGNRLWFELETRAVSEQRAAEVKNLGEKAVIFCAGIEWKKEHVRGMLRELGVPKAEEYKGKKNLTESVWSHIIIDSSFREASELLKMRLPYPCKKILILEASRMVIDGLQDADIILYEPFHVFMLAEVLNQTENKKKKQQTEEKLIFKTKGIRALVVDDNEVNLMVCTNMLKQYGIETDEADSGIMAVQKYYANEYDFIMMDYLMPGIDGVEATRRIRGIQKKSGEPVIIALSANITQEIRKRFEEAGAQEVMAKPLELKELSQVLRKWLEKDRIIENAEEKREREEKLSEEALRSVLRDVTELNIEEGLGHVLNSTENYIKVLRICCSNVAEQIAYVKAGYKIVSAVDLRINFHSLKGIFANVGANGLAERSREMEAAAGENDIDYIQQNVMGYIEAVEAFDRELDAALNLYKDILNATTDLNETYVPMEPEKYEEQIRLAKEAVRQYDFTEISRVLEELEKASQGKKKELLKRALEEISEFHYDVVMQLLEELEKV